MLLPRPKPNELFWAFLYQLQIQHVNLCENIVTKKRVFFK